MRARWALQALLVEDNLGRSRDALDCDSPIQESMIPVPEELRKIFHISKPGPGERTVSHQGGSDERQVLRALVREQIRLGSEAVIATPALLLPFDSIAVLPRPRVRAAFMVMRGGRGVPMSGVTHSHTSGHTMSHNRFGLARILRV